MLCLSYHPFTVLTQHNIQVKDLSTTFSNIYKVGLVNCFLNKKPHPQTPCLQARSIPQAVLIPHGRLHWWDKQSNMPWALAPPHLE